LLPVLTLLSLLTLTLTLLALLSAALPLRGIRSLLGVLLTVLVRATLAIVVFRH